MPIILVSIRYESEIEDKMLIGPQLRFHFEVKFMTGLGDHNLCKRMLPIPLLWIKEKTEKAN